MKINSNKGMYLETIIDNTIKYYNAHQIAILRKQWTPIKIHQFNKQNFVGNIAHKCDVDYYGLINQKFIAIEAKQCENNFFITARIKKHQSDFLNNVKKSGGLSYLIIYFQNEKTIFLVSWNKYYYKALTTKKIAFEWFKNNCIILKIIYPGWIDIISGLKQDNFKN